MSFTTKFRVTGEDGMTLEQAANYIKNSILTDDEKEFMLDFLKDIELKMAEKT